MGKLLRKFNRENGSGSMHRYQLESIQESEHEEEMRESTLPNDDEDDRPLEDHDGSEDFSD